MIKRVSWILICILILEVLSASATSKDVNNYPVIGIYALPSGFPDLYNSENYTFISNSYVNWVHVKVFILFKFISKGEQELYHCISIIIKLD